MYVSDLAIDNFRSYRQALVSFEPGVNVLVGKNGQGKTNLLESLIYLSTFSSHRVSAEGALLRVDASSGQGSESAVIRVKNVVFDRSTLLELQLLRGRANKAQINRTPVRPRELLGHLKTVTFAPEDLQILRDGPALRRAFLDQMLVQNSPLFEAEKSEYEKILRQRAALLKALGKGVKDPTSWEIWSEKLAVCAAKIMAARVQLINQLRPFAIVAHQQVAPEGKALQIRYEAALDRHREVKTDDFMQRPDLQDTTALAQELLEQMRLRQREEIARGINVVGAHRDDLHVTLDNLPVRGYASHGETWSAILALRIGEFQMFREEDTDPILILDDVFAELDSTRRDALKHVVNSAQQVFISAAVAQDLPEGLADNTYQVHLDPSEGSVIKKL